MENTNAPLKQGTRVSANGYEGVIVRRYNVNPEIYEIRLPGGVVAAGDFIVTETRQQFGRERRN